MVIILKDAVAKLHQRAHSIHLANCSNSLPAPPTRAACQPQVHACQTHTNLSYDPCPSDLKELSFFTHCFGAKMCVMVSTLLKTPHVGWKVHEPEAGRSRVTEVQGRVGSWDWNPQPHRSLYHLLTEPYLDSLLDIS